MAWLARIKPILTIGQLNRLSNIFDNAGQILFGITVVSPIVAGFDRMNTPVVLLLGLVAVAICWVASVFLARRSR